MHQINNKITTLDDKYQFELELKKIYFLYTLV